MIVVRVPGLEFYRFQYPNLFVYTLRVETNSIGLRAPATRFKNAAAGLGQFASLIVRVPGLEPGATEV